MTDRRHQPVYEYQGIPVDRIDMPAEGYWAVKLTTGGVEVAACIRWEQTRFEAENPANRMERSPILTARIDGGIVSIDEVWLRRRREITRAQYDFMIADAAWVRDYAPDDPKARPHEPVDFNELHIRF